MRGAESEDGIDGMQKFRVIIDYDLDTKFSKVIMCDSHSENKNLEHLFGI